MSKERFKASAPQENAALNNARNDKPWSLWCPHHCGFVPCTRATLVAATGPLFLIPVSLARL